MNTAVSTKAILNVRIYRDINEWNKKKLLSVRTKVSLNKTFSWVVISNSNEKTHILLNKSDYLVLPTMEISKVVMYVF